MSRRLGGVDLPEHVLWVDQDQWSPVRQTVSRTVDGGMVIHCRAQQNGRPVTLEIQSGLGWVDRTFKDQIQALAAQPGATFIFEWDDVQLTVMFAHDTPPACSFQPVWLDQDNNEFTGIIKLIQV